MLSEHEEVVMLFECEEMAQLYIKYWLPWSDLE